VGKKLSRYMDQDYFKKYEPFWDEWRITRLIGTGSYSLVFEIERSDYWGSYKAALRAVTISPQSLGAINCASIDMMDEDEQRVYLGGLVETIVDEINRISRLRGNRNVVYYEDHKVIPHSEGLGWDILIRMELLVPLDTYAKEQQLTRKDAIQLGLDMCRALEIYERRGIIHGDIKPEKILFSEREGFQLNACGVARIIDRFTGQLNETGAFRYMAPEIYSQEQFSPSSDQYSLGLVLYRMLNYQRLPFMPLTSAPATQRDLENALSQMIEGAEMPMPANGGSRLGRIVLKACAHRVADRYPSSAAMRMELSALLSDFAEERSVYLGSEMPETETGAHSPDAINATADRSDQIIRPNMASNAAEKAPTGKITENANITDTLSRIKSGIVNALAMAEINRYTYKWPNPYLPDPVISPDTASTAEEKANVTETQLKEAESKITLGAVIVLIWAGLTLFLALDTFATFLLFQGAVMGILGLGVLMRSWVCAISLMVFFPAICLYNMFINPSDIGGVGVVLLLLLLVVLVLSGVISTTTYHQIKELIVRGSGVSQETLGKFLATETVAKFRRLTHNKTSSKAMTAKEPLFIVAILFLIAAFVMTYSNSDGLDISTPNGSPFQIHDDLVMTADSRYFEDELANLWGKSPLDVESSLVMIEFEDYIPWGTNGFMDSRTTLEAYGYHCILRLGFADERLSNYTYRFLLEDDYVQQYRNIVEAGTEHIGEYDYSMFAINEGNSLIDLDYLRNRDIDILLAQSAGSCLTMWSNDDIDIVSTFVLIGATAGNDSWTMDFNVMKD